MNEETRKQIALCRYKILSPVLAESSRNRNAYFRETSLKEHVFPHYGPKKIAVSTLKSWLKAYNKDGFDGLIPKARNDRGRPRRLGEQELSAIRGKCRAFPFWTARKLYEHLEANSQLGHPPICYNSLLRIIKKENLLPNSSRLLDVNYFFPSATIIIPQVHLDPTRC